MATSMIIKDSKSVKTDCSICLPSYNEPKVLPCNHTFCLECLEAYGKGKNPVTCPTCRRVITIPKGGFKGLLDNFFMIQLIAMNQETNVQPSEKHECDACLGISDAQPATGYCVECEQHLCDPCNARHKNLKLLKDHKIIGLSEMPSPEKLRKMAPSHCQKHSKAEIKLYCYDCKVIACVECFIENDHISHKCSDVNKSAEEFRPLLKNGIDSLRSYVSEIQCQIKRCEEDGKELRDQVRSASMEISKKCDQLRSILDCLQCKLMNELKAFEEKRLKELETRKDEVDRMLVILDTFIRHCEEMKDNGTSCEIASSYHDLHFRYKELVTSHLTFMAVKQSSFDIVFTPSVVTSYNIKNCIGKLTFIDRKDVGLKTAPVSATSFLGITKVEHVITGSNWLRGVGKRGKYVLLAYESQSEVDIFNTGSFTLVRQIRISDSLKALAMVVCPHNKCLYVSTTGESIIRFDLVDKNESPSSWPVAGRCFGLSLSDDNCVLIALYARKKVLKYTTEGRLEMSISLDPSIHCIYHCIQLSDDRYVISHGGSNEHRVCLINAKGRIVKSFGGAFESDVDWLIHPRHLFVDIEGNIGVADSDRCCFNPRSSAYSPRHCIH